MDIVIKMIDDLLEILKVGVKGMFRVILVDDEKWVLSGLQELIPWEDMGFSIVACCQSGIEALQQIAALKPDVVVTDIRMPDLSGLELIEQVSAYQLPIEFVIISAYSDFEVARKAITYGAFSYLLKPLDEDEAMEMMGRLLKRLKKKSIEKPHLLVMNGEVQLTAAQHSYLRNDARYPHCCLFVSEDGSPAGDVVVSLLIDGYNGYLLSRPLPEELEPLQIGGHLPPESWGCSRVAPDFSNLSRMYGEACVSLETGVRYCSHPTISKVQYYLATHLSEPLTVRSIAQEFFLSELYLGELFKKCTGKTLIGSLKEMRLRYAARQMLRTRLELTEIAHRSGFQDYSYFGRSFKQFTGLSPENYRREQQK